ncbi:MAG: hypothetical protein R3F23_04860 [Verrucomicrobiia bacterium]
MMRRVPKGKVITINEIRQKLAKQHRVALCCPVTTRHLDCSPCSERGDG